MQRAVVRSDHVEASALDRVLELRFANFGKVEGDGRPFILQRHLDALDAVQRIVDYVQANPMTDECVGYIQNMGAIPAPVLTEEGRIVFRLQFACTYGE